MTEKKEALKRYARSSGPLKGEIESDLLKQGVLSTKETCCWTIFSRKDFMLFNPSIRDIVGLFFTDGEYATEYVEEKYKKSHKEVWIYRFCDNSRGWHCVFCHLRQTLKVFVRLLRR